jgi:hypothetical protein
MAMLNDELLKQKRNFLPIEDPTSLGNSSIVNIPTPMASSEKFLPSLREDRQGGVNEVRQVSTGAPIEYNAPSRILPSINEVPDSRRERELGKLTSSSSGGVDTYNINGNTLSYKLNDSDQQLKSNLEKLDKIMESGIDPATGKAVTPAQVEAYNQLRMDAGYMRGGTDRKPVGTDGRALRNLKETDSGLNIQFNPSVSQHTRQEVMQPSGLNDPKAIAARTEAHQQWLGRNGYEPVDPITGMTPSAEQKLAPATRIKLAELKASNVNEKANRNLTEKSTDSEIKLRDIQGQVALNPPVKESAFKPITLKQKDMLGNESERVLVPNKEQTGYVDVTPNQQQFTAPKQATIDKMLKMRDSKDPNLAAAEAEYKTRFGELPYK